MNAYDRFRQRLMGEPVDRPPNFDIMMTFAARHIREPLSRYYLNFRVLCDANLAGCEIPIGTPPVNLEAQSRALRDYRFIH